MHDFHWLQFSDLHLTPKANFDNGYARMQLLETLKRETICGHLPCDYIFITGDVAHKNDYGNIQNFIIDLLDALGWTAEKNGNVFWAVGNHDISRNNELRKLAIVKGLRIADDGMRQFEDWMVNPDFNELLLSKGMSAFFAWHNEILGRAPYGDANYPHSRYILPHLNLIVLNTCLTSCDDNDEHNLHIIEPGLLALFDGLNQCNPTFVIGHHGFRFFTESTQEDLGNLFDSKNVALYLCGHSHRLGYDEFPQASKIIPQITCGGGMLDGYAKLSFAHGFYNCANHEVTIIPYSYVEQGNKNWQYDGSLHRKLRGSVPIKLTSLKQVPPPIKRPVSDFTDYGAEQGTVKREANSGNWASKFFAASTST